VQLGREGQPQLREQVRAPSLVEREGNGDVGPLDQALPVGQKAFDQSGEARVGGVEDRANGVGGHLLQLAGDDGGEHLAPSRPSSYTP
jgi:hypothetical protein